MTSLMSSRTSPSRSTGPLSPEPRIETITESKWSEIALDSAEEALLESAGKALARGTDRYGFEHADSHASLVQVRRTDETSAQVRIVDAVGLIATPTVQLSVRPKIPVGHLLHILRAADGVPRLATGEGAMEQSDDLAVLIAHWFVTALERVLEEGLARDYRRYRDELTAVRGRILPLNTARLFYRGRVAVVADYEEYDFDTPLNRTMLHVARIVAGATVFPETLRRRALRASRRIDGVGWLLRSDATAEVDRRTIYYRDALSLARQIIAATGRTLAAGDRRSWTFLFRTPTPVEAGVRALAAETLAGMVSVHKGQRQLEGANMTINPDLVFEDDSIRAIGDVKYKLVGPEWDRSDLYEVVAFAAGFRVDRALMSLFAEPGHEALPPTKIGDHLITQVCWPADASLTPGQAATQFAEELRTWFLGQGDSPPLTSKTPA